MKKILLLLTFTSLVYLYHYKFNTIQDSIELDLPRWVLGFIQTSLTLVFLGIFYRIIFNKKIVHTKISQRLCDTSRKAYAHESKEISFNYENIDSLTEHFSKKGFKNQLRQGNRLIFKSIEFPSLLIDLNIKEKNKIELRIYPYLNLYSKRTFPKLDIVKIQSVINYNKRTTQ